MKIFYHSADFDGRCSGAILKQQYPDVCAYGIDYSDKFPFNIVGKDEIIYMVDFSLQDPKEMLKLREYCYLIWLDHHKSALENAEKHGYTDIPGL
jgi:oligoribonuclease NrnB/cAMP/cGMP phosphodiesterase (DHH superfamily)